MLNDPAVPERIEDFALSVLLHDIGKFWERSSDAPSPVPAELQTFCPQAAGGGSFLHSHAVLSARFLADQVAIAGGSRWGPRHHRPDPGSREELCAALGDLLAAGEAAPDDTRDSPQASATALRPPLAVTAESGTSSAAAGPLPPPRFLPPVRLDHFGESLAPRAVVPVSREDYRFLWNHFLSAADKLGAPARSLETWSALLEIFGARIPAGNTAKQLRNLPAVDLWSHSRAASAVAVALREGFASIEPLRALLAGLPANPKGPAAEASGSIAILAGWTVRGAAELERAGGGWFVDLLQEAIGRRLLRGLELPEVSLLDLSRERIVILAPRGRDLRGPADAIDRILREETGGRLGLEGEGVDLEARTFLLGLGGIWGDLSARLARRREGWLDRPGDGAPHERYFANSPAEGEERFEAILAGLGEGAPPVEEGILLVRREIAGGALANGAVAPEGRGRERLLAALGVAFEFRAAAAFDGLDPKDIESVRSLGGLDLDVLARARAALSAAGVVPLPAFGFRLLPRGGRGVNSAAGGSSMRIQLQKSGFHRVESGGGGGSLQSILARSAALGHFFRGLASGSIRGKDSSAPSVRIVDAWESGLELSGSASALRTFVEDLQKRLDLYAGGSGLLIEKEET